MAETKIKLETAVECLSFSGGYLMEQLLTLTMRDETGQPFDMNFRTTEDISKFIDVLVAKVNRTKRVPTINAKIRITLEVDDG